MLMLRYLIHVHSYFVLVQEMRNNTSTDSDKTFLSGGFDEPSPLFQKFIVDTKSGLDKEFERHQQPTESNVVAPNPGWCLKTWQLDGEKVFINICTSEIVLKPKDLSEDEVRKIVESEDPTKFRVPMGIGEAHKEQDHNGKGTYNKGLWCIPVCLHHKFF